MKVYPEIVGNDEQEWAIVEGETATINILEKRVSVDGYAAGGIAWSGIHEMAHLKWSPPTVVVPAELGDGPLARLAVMAVEDARVNTLARRVAGNSLELASPRRADLDRMRSAFEFLAQLNAMPADLWRIPDKEVQRDAMTGLVIAVLMGVAGWDNPVYGGLFPMYPKRVQDVVARVVEALWADGPPLDYSKTCEAAKLLLEEMADLLYQPPDEELSPGNAPVTPSAMGGGVGGSLGDKEKGVGKLIDLELLEDKLPEMSYIRPEHDFHTLSEVPASGEYTGGGKTLEEPDEHDTIEDVLAYGANAAQAARTAKELEEALHRADDYWRLTDAYWVKPGPEDVEDRNDNSRNHTFTESGVHPLGMHRVAIDRRVFRTKRRKPEPKDTGAIAIDVSGSMRWPKKVFFEVMRRMPKARVIAYSSTASKANADGDVVLMPRVFWLAGDGKVITADYARRVWSRFGGGNDGDLWALWWLAMQPEPRIWVSDGGICHDFGSGEVHHAPGAGAALQLCAGHRIIQVGSGEDLLELLVNQTLPDFDLDIYGQTITREAWTVQWDK